MLSDEVIEKVIERLVNRVENLNLYILKKIAKSIKDIGTLTPSDAHSLEQMIKYGGDYDKIVKKIAEITELNVKDIKKIFEEVAKDDLNFAKQFYDYRKKKYIPWEENKMLQDQVSTIAIQTAEKYANMANTKILGYSVLDKNGKVVFKDISSAYQDTIDEAILSVSQGKTTFQSEMGRIMEQIGSSGLKYAEYSTGTTRRLDSALKMAIKDGISQIHNQNQIKFGEEFGADGVEVSVHSNPAPDHAEVQGRQFYNEEFEKFQNDTDCVDVNGKEFPAEVDGKDRRSIGQYNCYHDIFPIIVGVSKPLHSDEELQAIIDRANTEFEFDGKKYNMYEGTQLQRKLETEIRKQKDIQIMAKEGDNQELAEKAQKKINMLTNKYKDLSDVSGLPTKVERLQVEGYRQMKIKDNYPPKPEKKAPELTLQQPKQPKISLEDEFFLLSGDLSDLDVDVDGTIYALNEEGLRNKNLEQLKSLVEKYPHNINEARRNRQLTISSKKLGENTYGSAYYKDHSIVLSSKYFNDRKLLVSDEEHNIKTKWHYKVPDDKLDIYTITHEYGHIVEYDYLKGARERARRANRKFNFKQADKDLRDTLMSRAMTIAGKRMNVEYFKDMYFSGYAKSKRNYEWFAELFAQMELGEETPFTQALKEWLEVYYK